MTGNRKQLGTAVIGLAGFQIRRSAKIDDERDGAKRFGVINRRRHAIKTDTRRKRRLVARLTFFAFDRFQQTGFFAANVGTIAMMRKKLEIEAGAENVLAQKSRSPRLVKRFFKARIDFPDFAVDIVITAHRAHRIGGDGHAFDHRMRVETQDVAVLEGSRFTLVRVADDVLVAGKNLGHETPLEARRKTCAATAAQHRLFHLVDDLIRRTLLSQNLLEC